MIRCCLFDLDGVIVDTACFHYRAWARLACGLGFEFTPEQGEATKGISRMASLDVVLRVGGMDGRFTPDEKECLAAQKNRMYLDYIAKMTPADVLPGVLDFLEELRVCGVKVVLGSASKNAGLILDRCAIRSLFDVVVDGTLVTRAKPDPEVFLLGAEKAECDPSECIVFEDAAAGIEAARRAGMRAVGVGNKNALSAATLQISSFVDFTFEKLCNTID